MSYVKKAWRYGVDLVVAHPVITLGVLVAAVVAVVLL
jgi:hypothetical protein